jgi:branched-chain amino acid transport system substrate-binding protein
MTPWLPKEKYKDRWFGNAAQFASAFAEKFGYPPGYHAAAAVAAVEALAVAMESARTFEAPRVRDVLAGVDFESVYGRIRFAPNGQIERRLTVVQIQRDEITEIFDEDFVHRPVYPVPSWEQRS